MHHSFLEYVKLVNFFMVLNLGYVEDKHVVSIQFHCLKRICNQYLKTILRLQTQFEFFFYDILWDIFKYTLT
jgi:hypothetical protein